MQKRERYKQILEVLLHNADGVTGEMLAKKFNISSRTIRSDIKS
ncbi:helix-turn-helix domain-containing protein, partial [uncultured Selenomonas sp.]